MLGSNFVYKDKEVSVELTSVFNYLLNNHFVNYGAGDEARTRDIFLGKEAFYHWITPAFRSVVYPLYTSKKNMQVPFLIFFKIPKLFLIYLILFFNFICLHDNLLL